MRGSRPGFLLRLLICILLGSTSAPFFLGHTQYDGVPHLRISLPAEGRRELHVAPLGLADVVSGGVDLGCHVQHVDAIFCHHWEKRKEGTSTSALQAPARRDWQCWSGGGGLWSREDAATSKKGEKKRKVSAATLHPRKQLPEGSYWHRKDSVRNTRCLHQTAGTYIIKPFPPRVFKTWQNLAPRLDMMFIPGFPFDVPFF